MEENNNNFLVKAIAATLILILALNVYRTESTKKQMDTISSRVESLSARIDTLEFPSFPDLGSTPSPNASSKQLSALSKSVANLESKVNNLQKSVDRISSSRQQQVSSNTSPAVSTASSSTASTSSSSSPNGRVSVSAKVKVENRYVTGTTYTPKVTTGPVGTVVIGVTMDRVGIVSKVSVNSGSTITDEDILDLCKECALKTHFAYNPDAPDKSTGTITYTFTAR